MSLGHEEVTFLVEIEVSTSGEASNMGIVEDSASLVFNGLSVDGDSLTETTNTHSGSLEGKSESSTASSGTTNLDLRSALMASLHEFLGQADNLSLGTVSLPGET